jgi:hypothetical protein
VEFHSMTWAPPAQCPPEHPAGCHPLGDLAEAGLHPAAPPGDDHQQDGGHAGPLASGHRTYRGTGHRCSICPESPQHLAPGQGQDASNCVALDPGGTASNGRIGPGGLAMRESSSVASGPADGIPGLPGSGARPTRGPPASAAAGSPETTLRLTGDHERIGGELNDLVAGRLFSAGLDLETARDLIGEHRAAGRIQHATSELDLAIRDIRDIVFDLRRTGSPAARKRLGVLLVLPGAVQSDGAWLLARHRRRPGQGVNIGGAIAERPGRCCGWGRCGRSWPVPPRIWSKDDLPGR